MKSKLIAGIVTLTVLGGTVIPTFAAVKENVNNNLQKSECSVSGSLLQGVTFKKLWWSNGVCGGIIIGGLLGDSNNGEESDNDSENVVPPTNDSETSDDNVSIPEEDGTTSEDGTTNEDGTTSVPDTPEVTPDDNEDLPSVDDEPSVDETPDVPNTPPVVDETPSTPSEDDTTNVDTNFMAEVEEAIFNKVNEERAKAGVSTLTYSTTMQKYARIKSQDMGDNNYFSHEDLNGNLITTQMKNDGVSYRAWGENIAYISGVSDADALAEQFMTNWMNSSGHRANILSENFESIGVGVYKIGNKVYATQEFYR